jgi:hypothetical protein
MIVGEGYVAENIVVRERLARNDCVLPITMEELYVMLLLVGHWADATGSTSSSRDGCTTSTYVPLFRCLAQIQVPASTVAGNETRGEDLVRGVYKTDSIDTVADVAKEIL